MATSHIVVTGPPGVGKTTTILRESGPNTVVATYTRAAATEVQMRGGRAGTLYSLTWPHVGAFVQGRMHGSSRRKSAYVSRAISNPFDPALAEYVEEAPSNTQETGLDVMARELHAWDGLGGPPFPLEGVQAAGPLMFILPMARWLEAGAPLAIDAYERGFIDEGQDWSALEYTAFSRCVEGELRTYGDPGQAIFLEQKGGTDGQLPYAWARADHHEVLENGYRVGDPVATVAARVLAPYWDIPPATFTAPWSTEILVWDPVNTRPTTGLVLAHSRAYVTKWFTNWHLTDVPVVSGVDAPLRMSNIHGSKGTEADDVYLLEWSAKHMAALRRKEPWALRLLYVAMTRSKRRLFMPLSLLMATL